MEDLSLYEMNILTFHRTPFLVQSEGLSYFSGSKVGSEQPQQSSFSAIHEVVLLKFENIGEKICPSIHFYFWNHIPKKCKDSSIVSVFPRVSSIVIERILSAINGKVPAFCKFHNRQLRFRSFPRLCVWK